MTNNEKICTHCNKGKVVHAKGYCKNCYDKQLKQSNPEYARRQNENMRAWRSANVERCKQREKERWSSPAYIEKERLRKWNAKLTSYGLTQEDYDQLIIQGCQLCGSTTAASYHLDHCHVTEQFRGLLCSRCNNGLGMLGDSIEGLEAALNYLKEAYNNN